MSLRVFGIVMHDGQGPPKPPAGAQLMPLREIAAVTEEGEYSAHEVSDNDVQHHLDVVVQLFEQDAVLPTPVGTVFRSQDVLQRWMDLHYIALSDALAWVENRVAARVHVSPAPVRGGGAVREPPDLPGIASEVTRTLRHRAVATVPLRSDDSASSVLSAAFLVDGELWSEFAGAVAEEQDRHPLLRIDLTGPWPPYDFVRLQFGA